MQCYQKKIKGQGNSNFDINFQYNKEENVQWQNFQMTLIQVSWMMQSFESDTDYFF